MSVTLVLFWLVKTQNASWYSIRTAAQQESQASGIDATDATINQFFEFIINGQYVAYIILLNGVLLTLVIIVVGGWIIEWQKRSAALISSTKMSLAESESKFLEAFNNAAIGMALVDLEFKWTKLNRSLLEILGYKRSELINHHVTDTFHPEEAAQTLKLEALLAGEIRTYNAQKRLITKSGETIWARLNLSLVKNAQGQASYFVLQLENITREKLLDEIKSDFISISSHQFRTPMSAIRWNLEALLDGDKGIIENEKIKSTIQSIHDSVVRMNQLITDLLRVAKIEGQALEIDLKTVNLPVVTKSITNTFNARAKAANKTIEIEASNMAKKKAALIDPTLFNEALVILIDNALLYSDNSAPIKIKLTADKKNLWLRISNQAEIIKSDDRKKMFEKLARLPAGIKKNPDGSGLGLYSAKRLLEAMKADLSLEESQNLNEICFKIKLSKG